MGAAGMMMMLGNAFWLALAVIFLIVEAAVPGLVSIWFAGGALVAFFCVLFGMPVWGQIPVFLIVSVLLVAATRPIAKKYNRHRTRTNAQSVIGKKAIVKEEIENLAARGLVTVDGMDWTARAETDEEKIGAGTTVEVLRIEGVKLIVRRLPDGTEPAG